MDLPNKISKIKTIALKKWENGANCAQATIISLIESYYLPVDCRIISDAFIPFGGGFREGSICGTVSGCLAAISMILMHYHVSTELMDEAFKIFKDMFQKECGSLECNSLLQSFRLPDGSINKIDPTRREYCTHLVEFAVQNAIKIIEKTLICYSS